MPECLSDKLARVSKGPGVYLMKDADNTVLYVGKARNLRSRVSSYFAKQSQRDSKTAVLIKKINTFDTILTATEQEALILESNLIKKYRPRYNVILKDDKRYPVIRLDLSSPYPNLTIVRKIGKDGALYFGPYPSAKAVHQTLKFINKTFQLRKCRQSKFQNRSRPCLHYQMGQCFGPCCIPVKHRLYEDMVREVVLFLNGRTPDLIRKIKKEMTSAADIQDFEKAAELRDKMFSLQKITEKQVAVSTDLKDRDVIGLAFSQACAVVTLLSIRSGYLVGYRHFEFQETIATDEEMITAFIRQFYKRGQQIPGELIFPVAVEDVALLENWLADLKGKRVKILCPQRGEKVKLVILAKNNAENRLKEFLATLSAEADLLHRLQKRLKMDRVPIRIECYDNSNTYGTNPVSGMVVFENAKAKRNEYRTYKLGQTPGPDDYAYMAEVLTRRFSTKKKEKRFPDLLMVDGGKGQLNVACHVVASLALKNQFHLIGIAKKDEKKGEVRDKVFLPGRANPVNFGREEDLLLFLQRIRDESHRLAVSFHRRRRRRTAVTSILDTIPGIGKKRKEALLLHFKSIKKIRSAAIEDLLMVPEMNRSAAEAVFKGLR